MKELTPKQARFVDEYLIDLNATQASIRAGYSAKTADRIGPELLGKTWVAAAIAERMKGREARTAITADKVMRDIEAIKQDAMKTIYDKDGNAVMADRPAALKACELQGKHVGAFTEKIDATLRGQIKVISEFPE